MTDQELLRREVEERHRYCRHTLDHVMKVLSYIIATNAAVLAILKFPKENDQKIAVLGTLVMAMINGLAMFIPWFARTIWNGNAIRIAQLTKRFDDTTESELPVDAYKKIATVVWLMFCILALAWSIGSAWAFREWMGALNPN